METEEEERSIQFAFPEPAPLRFSGSLLHVEKVSFAYPGTKRLVFKDINLTMELGDRVGLVGPNGHGKVGVVDARSEQTGEADSLQTTLLELITGSQTPTMGTITLHPRLKLSYYAQQALTDATFQSSTQTALEHFVQHAHSAEYRTEKMARGFLSQFDLKARIVDAMPVAKLSGGQRVKLILAEIMCSGPDLVIFDEVTTHLDSDSIQALIAALRRFPGAVLLISHDRQAIKEIVEGRKPEHSHSDDDDDDSTSSDDDAEVDGVGPKREGRTFLVKGGRMRLLPGGVEKYVGMVERDLRR